MKGMHVKLTFTFTTMGNCFPLVVTVMGLTKKEMPRKDFVHMEIPGLCISGGGVSVNSSQQVGHLFLMGNMEGAEKAQFRYYQEHILIPGINLQCKNYCNFDIAAGMTIPDMVIVVAWCDRDVIICLHPPPPCRPPKDVMACNARLYNPRHHLAPVQVAGAGVELGRCQREEERGGVGGRCCLGVAMILSLH
jgi:hypothetical protein